MSETIYNSSREDAINLYCQLQVLEDNGKDVGELKEEVFQRLVECIEEDDRERLSQLRGKLQHLVELRKKSSHWFPGNLNQ